MIYEERTLTFRELRPGFSAGGKEVSGILKLEKLGDYLTARLSPFHLATLSEGSFVCVIYDGTHLETMGIGTLRKNSPLTLGSGLCALLAYVGTLISPVAIATDGDLRCNADRLLSFLSLPTGKPTTPPAHAGGVGAGEAKPCPQEAESPEPSAPQEEYDDERLAEEDYFPERVKIDETYYRSVRDEVEASFAALPAFDGLRDAFPDSEFVRAGDHLLGKIYQDGAVRYLCFAAKTQDALPKALQDAAYFVPCSLFGQDEGYYMLFQDAGTGETVRLKRL